MYAAGVVCASSVQDVEEDVSGMGEGTTTTVVFEAAEGTIGR